MQVKNSEYRIARIGAQAGLIGALMIGISFAINPGPPDGATKEQLISFGKQYYKEILWGAWLQAVGPVLIMLFAITIVDFILDNHQRLYKKDIKSFTKNNTYSRDSSLVIITISIIDLLITRPKNDKQFKRIIALCLQNSKDEYLLERVCNIQKDTSVFSKKEFNQLLKALK